MENLTFDPVTHTYMFEGRRVHSVTTILSEMGLISTQFYTEEGRDRGKAVHKMVETHCRGAHCFRSAGLDPYLEAFINFEKDCDWVSEIIEEPMACKQFSGTPDLIGTFQGVKSIIDIKTSATLAPAYALQLAAYEKLYRSIYIPSVDNVRVIIKRYALQLMDTGRYILTEYKDRSDRMLFESALALFQWRINNKVRGQHESNI